MKTEIIAVGTELLLGQIVNTNASYLSEKLANIGYEVYYQSVVGDNPERLKELLKIASKRSELVVLCGGLGPTEDDLTKETVAGFIGSQLLTDQKALNKLEARIKVTHKILTPNNLKQAQYIEGGEVVPNDRGLAIGSFVADAGVKYLLLPGPPSELKAMVKSHVLPRLIELLPAKSQLTSRVLRFYGIGESALATSLASMIAEQNNPTIALYAKENEVTIRLTAKGENEEKNKEAIDRVEIEILRICGDYFYGYGEDNSLIKECFKYLSDREAMSIKIYDCFTDGRLTTAWENEGQLNRHLCSVVTKAINGQVLLPNGHQVLLSELDEATLTDNHRRLITNKSDILSILLIGDVVSSDKGAFFEGESWLSIQYNGEFYYKKTIYAGNEDTIKDRGVLEVTSFLRQLIRLT